MIYIIFNSIPFANTKFLCFSDDTDKSKLVLNNKSHQKTNFY